MGQRGKSALYTTAPAQDATRQAKFVCCRGGGSGVALLWRANELCMGLVVQAAPYAVIVAHNLIPCVHFFRGTVTRRLIRRVRVCAVRGHEARKPTLARASKWNVANSVERERNTNSSRVTRESSTSIESSRASVA